MRRQADLSYQTIATACQQLVEQGEKLSIRKIAQQTGGSYSTIATFFHRWQDEQALAKKVGASWGGESVTLFSTSLVRLLFRKFRI